MELVSRRIGKGGEILSIASDFQTEGRHRIAAGTRDGVIQLLELDLTGQFTSVFSVKMTKAIPKTVSFSEDGDGIFVFDLYDGDMYTLEAERGVVISTQTVGTAMSGV